MSKVRRSRTTNRFPTTAPISTSGCHAVYRLESIQVQNRYDFDGYGAAAVEWDRTGGGIGAACIKMRTNLCLSIRVTKQSGPTPADQLVLSFDFYGQTIASQAQAPQSPMIFNINTGIELAHGVTGQTITINKFTLQTAAGLSVKLPSKSVRLEMFTIFGPPIRDNVRETTLIDPGGVPGPNQVVRNQRFFSADHLRMACLWAGGASRLNVGGLNNDIVATVITSIPQITYGRGANYHVTNDGWNVWDNPPAQRTGDCSQQASFFADVLGTIGVRAHDFEIKCEYVHTDHNRYRRYFGQQNPNDWPCHGVVLVRYSLHSFLCYDTSFHNPRVSASLANALTVGPAAVFVTPQWQSWCLIPAANPNNVQATAPALDAALTTAYPEATWQTDMVTLAGNVFPMTEVQVDPGL
jgi:hypothetical protein